VRNWLTPDSFIVGPRNPRDFESIGRVIKDLNLTDNCDSYNRACRIVRQKRYEILRDIGRAIAAKLSNAPPPQEGSFAVVYNDVNSLSEILELEDIVILDTPIPIKASEINKPLEKEV
jgi:hypothetical protein